MGRATPSVKDGRLYLSETDSDSIGVGTPVWYEWLEQHDSFTFVDDDLTFTVRKGKLRTRGSNWRAFRRRQGKLYRIQLGHTHALTLERLQAAARVFAGALISDEPENVTLTQPIVPSLLTPREVNTVDNADVLIQMKLYRPRVGSDLIPRLRLSESLDAGLGGKVTLVSAPAGFGKSTLLAEWLQTIDRPAAWLSLDANDNELRVFIHSLTAALQSVFPDAFQATASLLKAAQFPPAERVAPILINDVADVPGDLILVLDDYHIIHNSEVHMLLDLLIEHMPSQLHLVLTARSDPPLPLARWRAKGYLHDLRRADLRFTREETQAFLTRVLGMEAANETVATLEEQTEGWIAVLRLAALSIRSASNRVAFLERLRHSPERSISSYLVEEILSQQTPAVQEFLVRISMLEQFCAGLCAAIMNSDASPDQAQAILDWLERSNLFLVVLDERQGWYRFHHLFQQLFQQRLLAQTPTKELATLHLKASAWFAERGLIDEALKHVLAAGDTAGAAHLVEAHFLPAVEQEQLVHIERWLRLLPEEQIQSSPMLLFARVWILQSQGQLNIIPRLLTAAEQLLEKSDGNALELDDKHSRILHAMIAIGWSEFQYFSGQTHASLESSRSALALLLSGEEYVASLGLWFLAWSNQAIGNEDVALIALQQALSDHSTHVNSTVRLLFAQAWIYLAAGKLHQVENTARHLLQTAKKGDLALSQNFAHWLLGMVQYEWNEMDAASYHFSAVITNQHLAHFWVMQDALIGLALVYQAKGLNIQAEETARGLLEWVQGQHNLRELMTAYSFRGRLALLQSEVESAAQWIEMAGEQIVLGPMIFFEDPPITKARLLLAKGDVVSVEHGQALLEELLKHVESIHNTHKIINVLALQAIAFDLQGQMPEALEVLERALSLARPSGYIRTFADLPALAKVLHELRKRRKAHQKVDKKLDAYIQDILVAMNPVDAQAASKEDLLRQEGLEPLTDREMQILHLLDRDLTNKEIASKLVLTPGTVKVHTNNVYRKLSVNNRRAAVTLAKALGFLTADRTSTPRWGLTS